MEQLTQEELNERVEILKKLRALLEMQRNKFREYLKVLEQQEHSIETENSEALIMHTELEQEVVKGIANLQKVIIPMSELYKSSSSSDENISDSAVNELQKDLSTLQNKVLAQNEKNRELLRTHMTQIKTQIEQFKNPYRNVKSVYAQKVTAGNFVEVEA
ncbi:MAG: flagellar biosynthesis protein FlgN [Treponema sp.]|nr:flagellar biosynthesis protein FlgN [Treponema sp.]MBQ1972145.1 flagellar biosynthesis protein FlgN [Treponema sp.]MBQ5646256.1 flagellar biosynthesis protein FlgN [Treponema sp.]MBQ5848903.1 flagellar biosynthesis protein FlgN [Treponema sp.]